MKKIIYLFAFLGIATTGNSQLVKAPATVVTKHSDHNPVVNTNSNEKPNLTNTNRASTIWSDDFSDPSTWMMSNTSQPIDWDWTIEDDPSAIPNAAAELYPFNSTTASNGFALINSDGQPGNVDGDGAIVASITTATPINLLGYENVRLSFEHNYRWWQEDRWVRVSGDNGDTWTTYEITTGAGSPPSQNSSNSELTIIDISDVAGNQSEVLVEFYYNDNDAWAWYWAVDDVVIFETPDNDMRLFDAYYDEWPILIEDALDAENFYDPTAMQDREIVENYEYSSYLVGQVRPLTFVGDVENQGMMIQTNVVLTAVFTGPDGIPQEFMSSPVASIEPGERMYISIPDVMPDAFADGGLVGDYTVTYSVSAAEDDQSPENNTADPNSFSVNSDYMANDIGDTWTNFYTTIGQMDAGHDIFWGHRFVMENTQDFNYIQFALLSYEEASTQVGEFLNLNIREGSVLADAGNTELLFGNDELVYTIESESELTTAGDVVWITYLFPDDASVTLEANTIYQGEVQIPPAGAGIIWLPFSDQDNPAAGVVKLGGEDEWSYLGVAPLIRLGTTLPVGVQGPSDLNFKIGQNYPNPTTGQTRIDWELLVPAKNVRFSVTDITGKTVYARDMGDRPAGVQEPIELELNLAAGNYQYGLTIGNQRIVRKMVVVK